MKYTVALHRSEEGYSISCPALPGCWSQGDTKEEALENIQDAIQDYLSARKALNEKSQAAKNNEGRGRSDSRTAVLSSGKG